MLQHYQFLTCQFLGICIISSLFKCPYLRRKMGEEISKFILQKLFSLDTEFTLSPHQMCSHHGTTSGLVSQLQEGIVVQRELKLLNVVHQMRDGNVFVQLRRLTQLGVGNLNPQMNTKFWWKLQFEGIFTNLLEQLRWAIIEWMKIMTFISLKLLFLKIQRDLNQDLVGIKDTVQIRQYIDM